MGEEWQWLVGGRGWVEGQERMAFRLVVPEGDSAEALGREEKSSLSDGGQTTGCVPCGEGG
ncbi:hypothetical protein AMTR_s00062p00031130 [Amborella trichopoda]|uniref:Uncharacterized protein n=1 Tax=Amborella trichopoda TaxID=13333 RepID=U5D1P5_AMBTC|nr:hypothetical protein AMTR_s00062p00031130 [Amborella trichopoda]